MESNSRISQFFSSIGEKIAEMGWFQQLRSKWEELDPQSRGYLRSAAVVGGILLALGLVTLSIWRVESLKTELNEKTELLTMIQNASDELRRLQDSGFSRLDEESAGPWAPYIESQAQSAGIDRTSLTVGEEKPAQAPTTGGRGKGSSLKEPAFQESLIEVSLKKINVKQLVRFAHGIEQGRRPVKVRSLNIETQPDLSGYLNATLAVSAFKAGTAN